LLQKETRAFRRWLKKSLDCSRQLHLYSDGLRVRRTSRLLIRVAVVAGL
jgi:hypothetical protein